MRRYFERLFWTWRLRVALKWIGRNSDSFDWEYGYYLKAKKPLSITRYLNQWQPTTIRVFIDNVEVCAFVHANRLNTTRSYFERLNYGTWVQDVWDCYQNALIIAREKKEAAFKPLED